MKKLLKKLKKIKKIIRWHLRSPWYFPTQMGVLSRRYYKLETYIRCVAHDMESLSRMAALREEIRSEVERMGGTLNGLENSIIGWSALRGKDRDVYKERDKKLYESMAHLGNQIALLSSKLDSKKDKE